MSRPADIGATLWHQAIIRGRNANRVARESLLRIVDEQPGPQTTAMLLSKAGLKIAELNDVLDELDEIGRKAKNTRSDS